MTETISANTATIEIPNTDIGTAPQVQMTVNTGTGSVPAFAGGRFGLLDYARMIGTPVGKTGALVGGLICNDEVCHRGTILTLAAAVAYYGYRRQDLLGYGLMASAAGAALYTLFDSPRITPGD